MKQNTLLKFGIVVVVIGVLGLLASTLFADEVQMEDGNNFVRQLTSSDPIHVYTFDANPSETTLIIVESGYMDWGPALRLVNDTTGEPVALINEVSSGLCLRLQPGTETFKLYVDYGDSTVNLPYRILIWSSVEDNFNCVSDSIKSILEQGSSDGWTSTYSSQVSMNDNSTNSMTSDNTGNNGGSTGGNDINNTGSNGNDVNTVDNGGDGNDGSDGSDGDDGNDADNGDNTDDADSGDDGSNGDNGNDGNNDNGGNTTTNTTNTTESSDTNIDVSPDLRIPDVNIPDVQIPDVNVPDIEIPNVEFNDITVTIIDTVQDVGTDGVDIDVIDTVQDVVADVDVVAPIHDTVANVDVVDTVQDVVVDPISNVVPQAQVPVEIPVIGGN